MLKTGKYVELENELEQLVSWGLEGTGATVIGNEYKINFLGDMIAWKLDSNDQYATF